MATATDIGIKVYDLMSTDTKPIAHLIAEDVKPRDTKEGMKDIFFNCFLRKKTS